MPNHTKRLREKMLTEIIYHTKLSPNYKIVNYAMKKRIKYAIAYNSNIKRK